MPDTGQDADLRIRIPAHWPDVRHWSTDLMMALHARRWLAGSGFRVPGLAVRQLTLPIGLAVLTMLIEELCGMVVHLGPAGAIRI
jgi:hypothetical protein